MKELLRFLTCGSVDDGKSTLIGHMLYDAKLIFADQKRALELDSKVGSADGSIDYSLLLDGLQAEREQGITIDVAYRFFSTENRSFIVADTPGHEEYTKNMAVGASFAELAVIIVDASHGVLIQTKRHTRICSLMGIRNFIFAINKMDLVGYDEKVFNNIKVQIEGILKDLPISSISIIPVSATIGDNLTHATAACGVVEYPLGEQGNVLAQNLSITRQLRERANGHRALTLWLSGLSGAGKSTLADAVEKQLFCSGIKTMILDGDNVRMGLCKGLGFSSEGRKENIRRVAEVAKLMNDAGILVIAAFISPMKADREMARQIIGDSYIEVYVNASLDDCINRDVKGMYQKAIRGEIREFTGISSPYEPPMNAEIIVNTSKNTVQECRDIILTEIRKRL